MKKVIISASVVILIGVGSTFLLLYNHLQLEAKTTKNKLTNKTIPKTTHHKTKKPTYTTVKISLSPRPVKIRTSAMQYYTREYHKKAYLIMPSDYLPNDPRYKGITRVSPLRFSISKLKDEFRRVSRRSTGSTSRPVSARQIVVQSKINKKLIQKKEKQINDIQEQIRKMKEILQKIVKKRDERMMYRIVRFCRRYKGRRVCRIKKVLRKKHRRAKPKKRRR